MNFLTVLNRSHHLRQQARDGYQHLSQQQAVLRRHLVIDKYTCVRVGLVLREEYQAADLMQDVIDDVKRPLSKSEHSFRSGRALRIWSS